MQKSTTRPIILASQSPRRKDLLQKMGITFSVVPSNFVETLDHSRPVDEVAIELALGKAREVAKKHPKAIVIGADTIVLIDGKQLGKPKDEVEARQTLHNLAGQINVVCTGMAVLCQDLGVQTTSAVSSKVFFKPDDDIAIEKYLASGDWHDKAGSYGIQSGAAPLIEYVEGEYDAVLGLPTRVLADLLNKMGISCRSADLQIPVTVRQPA